MTDISAPAFELDHITVSATSLEDALRYTEDCLGIKIPAGGEHPKMGTHNHLLSLGSDLFLEVIAVNPAAEKLSHPRWFGLDAIGNRSPKLATWILRTHDIRASLAHGPAGGGKPMTLTRGDLSWLMSVPTDGSMPMDGAYPTLIEWPDIPHPASKMQDLGCRLESMTLFHPEVETILKYLKGPFIDPRVQFEKASTFSMKATIITPNGRKRLGG
ncbi:MAG: VOC family protein [Sneathiella sp.]